MELILLERVENLGQIGDVVKVRAGYARNYLLPRKKALRANEGNRMLFEQQRTELEARNLERRKEAEAVAKRLDGQAFVVIRQASDAGLLYGSVTTRDIADAASAAGVAIDRGQVRLDKPLKNLGVSPVRVALHPEVSVSISINIARSEEEAQRQARGENVLIEVEEKPAEEDLEAAEFFEEGALREASEEGEKEND
jgi:large subunit ribosomal protein L9